MKRITISALFGFLLLAAWTLAPLAPSGIAQDATPGVSGHGKLKFRVLYRSDHLPQEAQAALKGAHGGFAVDSRPGRGEIYFSLKGAGIIQISNDLKSTRMIDTAPDMKGVNLHNSTFWDNKQGGQYLLFPSNEAQRVFVTDLDGKLLQTLAPPDGMADLGNPAANDYFIGRGNFVPTDVEQMDNLLYIATGYSNLDYVLTAKVLSTKPFKAQWHDLAFGGKGPGVGQFGTAHGITIPPGTTRIDIADRPNSEIDRFTRYGHYLSTLRLPSGSYPCDIFYMGNYGIIGSLHGPDRSKGAPIYILENDKLVSTIMPKEDLGLANFQHLHNAILKELNGKLYVIAQAWNPGDFAILEQVR